MFWKFISLVCIIVYFVNRNATVDLLIVSGLFAVAGCIRDFELRVTDKTKK